MACAAEHLADAIDAYDEILGGRQAAAVRSEEARSALAGLLRAFIDFGETLPEFRIAPIRTRPPILHDSGTIELPAPDPKDGFLLEIEADGWPDSEDVADQLNHLQNLWDELASLLGMRFGLGPTLGTNCAFEWWLRAKSGKGKSKGKGELLACFADYPPDELDEVADALEQAGEPNNSVAWNLAETALAAHPDVTSDYLQELVATVRQVGLVRSADWGTGLELARVQAELILRRDERRKWRRTHIDPAVFPEPVPVFLTPDFLWPKCETWQSETCRPRNRETEAEQGREDLASWFDHHGHFLDLAVRSLQLATPKPAAPPGSTPPADGAHEGNGRNGSDKNRVRPDAPRLAGLLPFDAAAALNDLHLGLDNLADVLGDLPFQPKWPNRIVRYSSLPPADLEKMLAGLDGFRIELFDPKPQLKVGHIPDGKQTIEWTPDLAHGYRCSSLDAPEQGLDVDDCVFFEIPEATGAGLLLGCSVAVFLREIEKARADPGGFQEWRDDQIGRWRNVWQHAERFELRMHGGHIQELDAPVWATENLNEVYQRFANLRAKCAGFNSTPPQWAVEKDSVAPVDLKTVQELDRLLWGPGSDCALYRSVTCGTFTADGSALLMAEPFLLPNHLTITDACLVWSAIVKEPPLPPSCDYQLIGTETDEFGDLTSWKCATCGHTFSSRYLAPARANKWIYRACGCSNQWDAWKAAKLAADGEPAATPKPEAPAESTPPDSEAVEKANGRKASGGRPFENEKLVCTVLALYPDALDVALSDSEIQRALDAYKKHWEGQRVEKAKATKTLQNWPKFESCTEVREVLRRFKDKSKNWPDQKRQSLERDVQETRRKMNGR